MTQQAATQPHGHLKPFYRSGGEGCKMRVRDTTGHLLGRGIHVGDIMLMVPLAGTGTQETTVVATDYTKTGMSMLDETGVLGVIQPPPPEIGVTATYVSVNFARAWVVLPAASSKIKAAHGMEIAAIATVSTKEPQSSAVALAAIDEDVRATCGPGVVLAKVKLPTAVTALVAGTPLVVYGASQCTLAPVTAGNVEVGARVVGYLARAISGATAAAIVLAEVDFDGEHGFGVIAVNPTP